MAASKDDASMRSVVHVAVAAAATLAIATQCACGSDSSATGSPTPAPTAAGPKGAVHIGTFTGNGAVQTSVFRIDTTSWMLHYTTAASNCKGASMLILVFDNSYPGAFIRNIPFSGCTSGTVNIPFGPSDFFLRTNVSSNDVAYTLDVSEVR